MPASIQASLEAFMDTYTIAGDYRYWCVTSRTLAHSRTQEEAPLPILLVSFASRSVSQRYKITTKKKKKETFTSIAIRQN